MLVAEAFWALLPLLLNGKALLPLEESPEVLVDVETYNGVNLLVPVLELVTPGMTAGEEKPEAKGATTRAAYKKSTATLVGVSTLLLLEFRRLLGSVVVFIFSSNGLLQSRMTIHLSQLLYILIVSSKSVVLSYGIAVLCVSKCVDVDVWLFQSESTLYSWL